MQQDSEGTASEGLYASEYEQLAFKLAAESQKASDSQRPDELFHYTTTDGMRSIVETKCLWATDIRFFKDPSELKYGVDLFRRAVGTLKKARPAAHAQSFLDGVERAVELNADLVCFVTRFCEDGDLLSQWRGYGGRGGYAIGFSGDFAVAQSKEEVAAIGTGVSLLKIEYDPDVTVQRMTDLIGAFLDLLEADIRNGTLTQERAIEAISRATGALSIPILQAKHPKFSEEKEWRLVVIAEEADVLPLVRFRTTETQLIPYLPVSPRGAGEENGPLPIRSVTVAPTIKATTAPLALRIHLDKAGNKSAVISDSKIPLIA